MISSILSAWINIINGVSKLASPLPSNFSCLLLTDQVVCLQSFFYVFAFLPRLVVLELVVGSRQQENKPKNRVQNKFTTFQGYHRLSENGEEWTHCAESSFLILLLDGDTISFSAEDGTSSESSNKSLLMSMVLTKSKDLKIVNVNI